MSFCPTCGQSTPDGGQERMSLLIDHDPTKCNWHKGSRGWSCEHGVFTPTHPRGWCDQGCCR